jgi:rubrerythrin
MDNFKDTILKMTQTVTKTSGELLKSTKLSLSLTSEEDKLKKIYLDIGKKVHEIYAYGGNLGKFFDDRYKDILATENKIKELRDQLDTVRGVKTCVKCGKSVDRSAEFCPKCGGRMDGVPEAPRVPEAPHVPEAPRTPEAPHVPDSNGSPNASADNKHFCPFCGAANEKSARFCLTCGRMM